MIVFLLPIINLILLGSNRPLYIKKLGCSMGCDGSFDRPFPDLKSAFEEIKNEEFFMIKLLDGHLSISENETTCLKFFDILKSINLLIDSEYSGGMTTLMVDQYNCFFFILRGGTLILKNIIFQGALVPESLDLNFFSSGFIQMSLESNFSLHIENCEIKNDINFEGKSRLNPIFYTFINVESSLAVGSLVYIKDTSIRGTYFRGGLISSNIGDLANTDSLIVMENTSFTNYSSSDFAHWEGGFSMKISSQKYSDFALIINKTKALLKNITLVNTYRFLLAVTSSTVEISKINILANEKNQEAEKVASELIYLLQLNMFSIRGLVLSNSNFFSYDDEVEIDRRDIPILAELYYPSVYINLERNQALFAFGYFNYGELNGISINNCTLYKNKNFAYSVFSLEYFNQISFSEILIKNLTMDTESMFGYQTVIYVSVLNKIRIENIIVMGLNIYGYSSLNFGVFKLKNEISASNLKFSDIYLKSKSNNKELETFLDLLNYTPEMILVLNSASMKSGSLFCQLLYNNMTFEKIDVNKIACVYGCLHVILAGNIFLAKDVKIIISLAEKISSAVALAIQNYMEIENMVNIEGRANTGSIFAQKMNQIIIKNSNYISNWGTGGFSNYKNFIAGIICLDRANIFFASRVTFKTGKADLIGGSINCYQNNNIDISFSDFIENESSGSTSKGGVIFADLINQIKFYFCNFINNFGTYGGVLYGKENNFVTINDCNFEQNQGEYGSILYLQEYNRIFLTNTLISRNQGFVIGGLFCFEGVDQIINIHNASFLSNQSPFKGCLIEINSRVNFTISFSNIEYGDHGNGDFVRMGTENVFSMFNISVQNIFNLNKFVSCLAINFIKIIVILIKNNIWLDSFIYSYSNNYIITINGSLQNITVKESASGFLNAVAYSTALIINYQFLSFSIDNCMILSAVSSSNITLEGLFVYNITVSAKGACMHIGEFNNIKITEGSFYNFFGLLNDEFLLRIFDLNSILLEKVGVFGEFTMEQSWNQSCLLNIYGYENILNMISIIALSRNAVVLRGKKILFINFEGSNNTFVCTKSNFTFENYHQIFNFKAQAYISLLKAKFKDSRTSENFININSNSQVFFSDVIFANNILEPHFTLIKIANGAKANFINITSNTNNIFIKTSGSNLKIKKSKFCSLTSKNSSALFIFEEKTEVELELLDIFLKRNDVDTIILASASKIIISHCILLFNKGYRGGVFRLMLYSTIGLNSNKIIGNQAEAGGFLYFDNASYVALRSNNISFNRAIRNNSESTNKGKGGCIYVDLENHELNTNFSMENNIFNSNGAEIGGLLYLYDRISVEYFINMGFYMKNSLRRTKIKFYGVVAASRIGDISLIKGSDLNQEVKDEIFIRDKLRFKDSLPDCVIQIINKDLLGQVMFGEYDLRQILLKNETLGLDFLFTVKNHFLCLSSIIPNSFSSLSSNISKELKFMFNSSDLTMDTTLPSKQLNFTFQLEKCLIGEFFDLKNLQCLPCEPNFFSFDKNFLEPSSCRSCVQEPFYCYGGFNLTPKQGYWRRDNNSINFIKCPNPLACLGDPELFADSFQMTILNLDYSITHPSGICALGYEGVLCFKCEKGFAKTEGTKCSNCSGKLSIFLMIFKILLRIILYYYTIYKALMMCLNLRNNQVRCDLVYSNFLLKILILHLQFLKSFLSFPFIFPSISKESLGLIFSSVSSGADKVLNLECFIDFYVMPPSYVYCFITIVTPLIVVTTLFIYENLQEKYRKEKIHILSNLKADQSFKLKSLPYLFVISLMLTYDEIISLLMQNFSSINIDDEHNPDYRFIKDMEIGYSSPQHQFWIKAFAFPALITLGFAIPSFIFLNIWRIKKKRTLKGKTNLFRFGYFYFAFDENHVFYEAVYVFRKIFLTVIDTFFINLLDLTKDYDPSTLSVILCFFYTGLSIITSKNHYKADLYPALNKLDRLSVTIQALTSWIGCFLLTINESNKYLPRDFIYLIGFSVSFALNSAIFLIWGYIYWTFTMKKKLREAFRRIKKRYSRKKTHQNFLMPAERPVKITKISSNLDIGDCDLKINPEELSLVNENYSKRDDEEKDKIYFAPHYSSIKTTSPSHMNPLIRKGLANSIFYKIENKEFHLVSQFQIDGIWKFYLEEPDNFLAKKSFCLGSDSSKYCDFINFSRSRSVISRQSVLEYSISIKLKFSVTNNIYTSAEENKEFCFIFRSVGLDSSKTQISFKLIANRLDFSRLRMINKAGFALFVENEEGFIKKISFVIEMHLFDFLVKVNTSEDTIDDAFSDLLRQGIKYSFDSSLLQLETWSSDRLVIQLVKTRDFIENESVWTYYIRELSENRRIPFICAHV